MFLKLNQSRNMKNKFLFGCFFQKPKTRFFGGKNKIVLKLKFKFVFLRLFFFVKGSFVPIFTNKYWYLSFENFENFDVRAPVHAARTRAEILDFDF